jgi:hypothetical protein
MLDYHTMPELLAYRAFSDRKCVMRPLQSCRFATAARIAAFARCATNGCFHDICSAGEIDKLF